ncbi:NAD(P)-dependent oxidoreductase [Microvirga sp. KLBC 81]|uniref:SDR family oxidoreductase n=1 Tax=Microvirga sp. KLBC 81 TaxID=1862707 RepID=UPI000D516814|nr:SDR family oxidoreductase [Microvirga sp. KLBC 81]PVE21870.1 NAD(P)-dependent oxidoreductase [Microvirga sp. KLBC 81]
MAGKILVLGATGNVGKPLVAELVAKGEPVKAASRAGNPVSGAQGVKFDFADQTTYAQALEGVDRAYVLVPTGTLDILGTLMPFLKLAIERKVKVVLQSVFGVDADDSIPYRQAELFLERSGAPYVILRPNWFTDNFQIFWLEGIKHGVIAVPAGQGKSSFIDVRDIASSAAAALTSNRFDGQAFNLTGPEALSYGDAAAILSKASGRPIAYKASSDAEFVTMLVNAGVPKAYAEFLASIFHPVREGWTAAVSNAVQTLTGKAPRSVEAYARENAVVFAA